MYSAPSLLQSVDVVSAIPLLLTVKWEQLLKTQRRGCVLVFIESLHAAQFYVSNTNVKQ